MTPSQIAAVQDSFTLVLPIKEPFASLFYLRLFETDPATRDLFRGNRDEQARKLMSALAMVVGALGNLRAILPVLEDLARRHVDFGVEDHHYDSLGSALLTALQTVLGDGFSQEAYDAWTVAYGTVAKAMIEATKRVKGTAWAPNQSRFATTVCGHLREACERR